MPKAASSAAKKEMAARAQSPDDFMVVLPA
jgi:hypothetical protein